MSALNTRFPYLTLPTGAVLWLLEVGLALSVGAYLAYLSYAPIALDLSQRFNIHGGLIPQVLVVLIVFPLALALMAALVLFAAGLLPPKARTAFDVLAMTIVITALIIPTWQQRLNTASPPAQEKSAAAVATGPLNAAPPSLKIERIQLGAEITNIGAQPLDVGVQFVTLTGNRRAYCAGTPLTSGRKDRHRIAPGALLVYMSGNCQNGNVAVTVWDVTGLRIYQTSVTAPPDSNGAR
jgi:hypothetical protein